MINENEAVPLALIMSELITNAVKYNQPSEAVEKQVEITLDAESSNNMATIKIVNRGRLESSFNFEQRSGLGTGLQLVSTLLPKHGMKLLWQQQDTSVITIVQLSSPVII